MWTLSSTCLPAVHNGVMNFSCFGCGSQNSREVAEQDSMFNPCLFSDRHSNVFCVPQFRPFPDHTLLTGEQLSHGFSYKTAHDWSLLLEMCMQLLMLLCGWPHPSQLTCMQDWLFLAVYRVRGVEYGLLVATFVAIMVMGLELGIAAGIVAASLLFAYNYSKVPVGPNVHNWLLDMTLCMISQGSHAYWMAPCVLSISMPTGVVSICCTAVLCGFAASCTLAPLLCLKDVHGLICTEQGVRLCPRLRST